MTSAAAHFHYHIPRLRGAPELLWAHSIRGVAENLVSVFIPIYLYKLGYPLPDIMLFLVMEGVFWFCTIYPMMRLMNHLGTKRTMAFSMVGNVTLFLLLVTLPAHHWPLLMLSLVWGLFVSAYWPAFRISFASALAHKKTGRYVSIWSALTSVASGLAPAVGGIVATLAGINAIYLVAVGLFCLAALPLLTGPEFVRQVSFSVTFRQLRQHVVDFVANGCESYHDTTQNFVWPLFIFFLIPSYAGVGVLSSVLVLASIAIALYVGRREEVRGEKHYLREGVTFVSLGNILQVLAQNAAHIFGINLLSGVGYALYLTPFNTKYYERIEQEGLPYLLGMQAAAAVGYALCVSVLFVLSFFLTAKVVLLTGILLAVPFNLGIARIR